MADVSPRVPATPAAAADPDAFVLRSGVRSGLKRELAFALKAQAEILASPRGRTRSGKIPRSPGASGSAAVKRPRTAQGGGAASAGAGPHAGTDSVPRPPSASPGWAGASADNVIILDADDEQMPAAAADASPSAIQASGETVAEASVPVEADSGTPVVTPPSIQVEERTMEVAASPIQTDEPPVAGNPARVDDRTSQMEEENAVPGKSSKRFTRSLLKAAAEETAVPEKPSRRFTRSLLKTAVEGPQSSAVERPPPLMGAGVSSAASGRSGELEEAKDAADTANETDERLRTTPKKKMELKMSKKIALTKVPSNIKELLATGLLEGLPVNYVYRSYDKQGGLRGVIKDGNILCFCASCKGLNTVSAYNFEVHAGSAKKHPSDHIYLENGRSLHDVIRACTSAPLDMLESAIQNAIGPAGPKSSKCDKCKESSDESHIGKLTSVCESCLIAKLSPMNARSSQEIISSERHVKPVLASHSSDSASRSISSQKKSGRGRMTTKDLRLHKLVFEDGILPDGTEVAYYARGQRLLEGYIKEHGIYCHCCNAVVSPSQFEAHAGWASRRKPYLNIYTSNGVSLHELAISLSKDKKFSTNESDDLCRICADGGDLLLCDLCPRAFHKECVGLTSIPKGDWYCPCCQSMHQKEKFVKHNKNAIAAGRVAGADPIEEIYKRCIRIVKTPETDIGSCVLCRCHDFNKNGFGPRTVMLCDQCEREFHVGCLKDHNMADLKELPEGEWFCSSDCIRIHAALQNLLTCEPEYLPDLQADVIKRKCDEKDINKDIVLDVRWRLLSGKTASSEARLLLSEAVSIFHNGFKRPRIWRDVLCSVDCEGFDISPCSNSVVSAGILRVLGCEVAELPLVATSRESQGKGYFQTLFLCIEKMLDSLNVKHLVLPAADEAESIWINKFGFRKVSAKELLEYTRGSRIMVFHGTSMLHKLVSKISTDCVQQKETG
ncbi:hypothetical protein Taro_009897 [Colocasia esculenta]|uniref:PHD-type domain-containing protein n=1 Tax=Colocasia esculenta TaxID=4460 RepID=A0A843U1Q6_COLES|nr:hypothetical protein [Colocasia esculenta]